MRFDTLIFETRKLLLLKIIIIGQPFAQLQILKVPQTTLRQIGEFMHHYTYNTLPNAFDNYFNRASVFHSYHTRNSTQYRIEFAHTNTCIFAIKIAGLSLWNSLAKDLQGRAVNVYPFTQLTDR